jgi:hypothetical protein
MADTDPDPLAGELAAITDRAANELEKWLLNPEPSGGIHMSAHDVPRLLKAVDAVLARHQPGPVLILGALCHQHEDYRYFSITAPEAATIAACPDCAATVCKSCSGCDKDEQQWCESDGFCWPCPTYRIIAGALTGEDTPTRPLTDAGCPSPAQPDADLARALFDSVTFHSGERLPVNGGTWLRESYGSGTVACEQCGRLAADSIEFMPMAQLARDHAAETGHEVVVRGSRSALYGPEQGPQQ